jgi:hypothetical protein
MLTAVVVAGALVAGAADVQAMSWSTNGNGRTGGPNGNYVGGSDPTKGSVPEPSTLYAVGSALALLGGAGWYIRRRK